MEGRSAADAAFREASQASGIANLVPAEVLACFRAALLSRVTSAAPRILTSARSVCFHCGQPLYESSLAVTRDPRASCWIMAEPTVFQLNHVPRWCKRCLVPCAARTEAGDTKTVRRPVRYWCGFVEEPVETDLRAYTKRLDAAFVHPDFWLTTKSFGVSCTWLRRWRYRNFVHRASFLGEATVFRPMDGPRAVLRAENDALWSLGA